MGQFNFKLTARRTMVSKLVASCSLVLIPALIWADKLVPHAVHHAPVHHAAPYAPAPYGPVAHHTPAPHAPHGAGYGYCDPKAPPQSADDLVDGIAKPQEEHFDYSYYTGASKGPSKYDASHWIGPEGYLCPSDVDYAKITRA